MSDGTYEFSGKTVEEAVQASLKSLGLTEKDVDVEIVSRGSRGIFGLGSEPALVRVSLRVVEQTGQTDTSTPPVRELESTHEEQLPLQDNDRDQIVAATSQATTPPRNEAQETSTVVAANLPDEDLSKSGTTVDVSDDELAQMSSEMLAKLVTLMDFEADIETSWQEADENGTPYLLLNICGNDLGALIGRRGETLTSLQYLLRLMVNQRLKQWMNIVVDVEHYKQRRVNQLTQLAERMARQVVDSGRSIALEPMPASERRIVHLTLRDNPDVFTESIGEGERRKVTIAPRL